MTWQWANFTEHYFLTHSANDLIYQIDSFLRCYCQCRVVFLGFLHSRRKKVGQPPGNKDASSRLQDVRKFRLVINRRGQTVSELD